MRQGLGRGLGLAVAYALAIQLLAAAAFPMAALGWSAPDAVGVGLCVGDAAGGPGDDGRGHSHRHPAGLPCHFLSGCVSAACGSDNASAPVLGALDVPLRLVDFDFRLWSVFAASDATYRPANARAPPLF
jgi:hypothetical protein